MQIPRFATLGCVAATTMLVIPAAAHGAAFTSIKPCYVSLPTKNPVVEQINLAGNGFAPNVPADIQVNGATVVAGAPVDAGGALGAVRAPSPFIPRGERPFGITALQNGVPVATAATRATALDVSTSPRRTRPSRGVRFRGRGFTGGSKVYAHYRYKGRTRRTVTFKAKGACGKFNARKRQIPVSNPGSGNWTVQFDQQKRYTSQPRSVFVRLTIKVTRVVRFKRASAADVETGGTRVVAAGLGS